MSDTRGPVAMLGGAFDPLHYGHLRTAYELFHAAGLAEVRFVPSSQPAHRDAHIASGELRMQMLSSVTSELSWARADDIELRRDGPSWSVLTLTDLRSELGERSLCMIVGMDAFLGLPEWHRWEEICELAHLLVAHRPGWVPPDAGVLGELLRARRTHDAGELHSAAAGRIFVHAVTQLDISSSAIRADIAAGTEPRYLVPDSVNEIIQTAGCYSSRS